MGRKTKYTKEIKIQVVIDYQSGRKTLKTLSEELNCDYSTIRNWIANYTSIGEKAFDDKPCNNSYTKEFKLSVVQEYISGKGSLYDLIKKYKIYSKSTLRNWILLYNNGKGERDYIPKKGVYAMKSRKVSYEERIEIVNDCIANDNNYKETADKYNVPYSQVYTWVKKVNKSGYESLKLLKKGRKPKTIIEIKSPEEKLEFEIEKLRLENERLKLENEVLKKKHRFKKRTNSQKCD